MKYALILFIVLLIGCKTVTKTVQVDNIITTEFHDTVIVVERRTAPQGYCLFNVIALTLMCLPILSETASTLKLFTS